MFSSIHSQRWVKWLNGPKKFIVNLEIRIDGKYTFKDVEVYSRWRAEAIDLAKDKVMREIEIVVKGSKSLGKVKKLYEF